MSCRLQMVCSLPIQLSRLCVYSGTEIQSDGPSRNQTKESTARDSRAMRICSGHLMDAPGEAPI